MPGNGGDDPLHAALSHARAAQQNSGLTRQRRVIVPIDAVHVEIEGRTFINFASNNYLGLTHHPRMIDAVARTSAGYGAGSGASALITGYTPQLATAEQTIARWKQKESAVILPSGYQASHAAVQTFARLGERGAVRFLIDKLAHASLIDAVRATSQPFRVFPHNNFAKLSRLLDQPDQQQLQVVITESIFSMDGDAADLAGLQQLKRTKPFALLLDEAHGTGTYGPAGAGYAAEIDLADIVDVSVITLSKAMGAAGGAICASSQFIDALANFGRAYIYSTAVPPTIPAAATEAIAIMAQEPWRQQRVRQLAKRVRAELKLVGGDSPIIPIILGDAAEALAAARALEQNGLLVVAVRPPTVPPGTSRLRVTLSAAHDDSEVGALIAAIQDLNK